MADVALTSTDEALASPSFGRRLFRITGVLPLGVFLAVHLFANATALAGSEAFDAVVTRLAMSRASAAIELAFVLAPLAYHGVYGLLIMKRGDGDGRDYAFYGGLTYRLQAVSGVLALAAIAGHFWELRVQRWFFGLPASALYTRLAADMSSTAWGVPWVALGYLLGLVAITFHFASGVSAALIRSRGITRRRDRSRLAGVVFALSGGMLLVSSLTVIALATGSRPFPARGEKPICAPAPGSSAH